MKNQQSSNVPTDIEVQIKSIYTKTCISYRAGGINDAIFLDCDDKKPQNVWTISQNSDGTYKVKSKVDNIYWEVYSGSAQTRVFPPKDSQYQNWKVYPSSYDSKYWNLQSVTSPYCLDNVDSGFLGPHTCPPSNVLWGSFEIIPVSKPITISGYIKDATNNKPITDQVISVKFTLGGNTYPATVTNGVYQITLPNAGVYTRDVTVVGYIPVSDQKTITQSSDETNLENQVIISPIFEGWRIVLTWGKTPRDLDSHIKYPGGEVSYQQPKSDDGNISLDTDAKFGHGPETISIKNINSGIFNYFVNNYSKEDLLTNSQAKVRVYKSDQMVQEFSVPRVDGSDHRYNWRVFTLDIASGIITPINDIVE